MKNELQKSSVKVGKNQKYWRFFNIKNDSRKDLVAEKRDFYLNGDFVLDTDLFKLC